VLYCGKRLSPCSVDYRKAYGEAAETGISVTHAESRTIRENSIPMITLIDKEVWTFKRVYDENKANSSICVDFPGMDVP
jgi:hypothetical protein